MVKAVILAAGYATRLRPLTDHLAKPLLRVGGRPLLDHLYDQLGDPGLVSEVHVVTNRRFSADFVHWAGSAVRPVPVQVHDDGTTTPENRLGAIGDLALVVARAGLGGDDLLVVAGDNLLDYRLADFAAFFRAQRAASAIALYACESLELVERYSAVELGSDGRVVSFVEKPPSPRTRLAGTATYLFHRDHVPRIREYLDLGGSPDQPGRFVEWLHSRVPVFGYPIQGQWFDIGDLAELRRADRVMRARQGMSGTSEYDTVKELVP